MTSTTKYVLIGAAALVGVVFISKRIATAQAAASKPTGIAGAIAGVTSAVDSLKGVSWSAIAKPTQSTLASSTVVGESGGGKYYGPGAADGVASGADAMGTRALKPQITASTLYYDRRFAGVKT